jgi:hypothetical protein
MFDGFHARNCALLGSIPSGMFSGDGTLLPGLCGSGVRSKGDPNVLWGGEHSTSPPPIGTELVGYFNPHDTGTVFGSTYKNLVSGQSDLVIYNGMSYTTGFADGRGFHSETSGAPCPGPEKCVPPKPGEYRLTRYFEADGVDDFLGPLEATNYDDTETGLYLNYKGAWHVSMWVNFPEQSWENSGSEMFSCGPQGFMTWDGYVARMRETGIEYDFAEQAAQTTSSSYIKPVEKDRWYFVSFENNGDKSIDDATDGFTMAVDGKVLPHQNVGGPYNRKMKSDPIYIGASYTQYQVEADVFERSYMYARSGTKFGEIMVYSGDIGINRIIQNFIATRENYNRHSGEKNPYFIEGAGGDTFSY